MNRDHAFEQRNRRFVLFAYDWIGTLVIALIILSFLLAFAFRVVGVKGGSMLPTLKEGDKLLLSTYGSTYYRGDVIVVDRYTDEPLIKRVIALGGDTVSIDEDGVVTVNGKVLKERYIQGETVLNDFPTDTTVTVPTGSLFVMGDNRTTSKDSRSAEIGFVSRKDVVGRALGRIWPLRSIGRVRR